MTEDDFLAMTLAERVIWLHSKDGPRGFLSHDSFAAILGTTRQVVINWENGAEPRKFVPALVAFSGFRPEVFSRRGAEEVAQASFARRLATLEERLASYATKEDLTAGLETLREAIQNAATQGTRRKTAAPGRPV